MKALGKASFDMIKEVRSQFKEIPGLIEDTSEPDTALCIDIATTTVLKRVILPGLLASLV